ncbi:hypothetical protein [Actinophytocola sp.]|uniref:hypothetical protein n=1 Tax=Actinophytocola sp. TaxID=1872138 RepID=UPI002ED13D64
MSVQRATFSGMIENDEADQFRRIQLVSKVERAKDVIARIARASTTTEEKSTRTTNCWGG